MSAILCKKVWPSEPDSNKWHSGKPGTVHFLGAGLVVLILSLADRELRVAKIDKSSAVPAE